jgi:hypothetical protein
MLLAVAAAAMVTVFLAAAMVTEAQGTDKIVILQPLPQPFFLFLFLCNHNIRIMI